MTVSTLVDRTQVYITSTGTGALALGSAVAGFQGTEALIDGAQYSYSILTGRAAYEFGKGTYNAALGTLTRTPQGSSDGGAPISVPTNAQVAFTVLSDDLTGIVNEITGAVEAAQTAASNAATAAGVATTSANSAGIAAGEAVAAAEAAEEAAAAARVFAVAYSVNPPAQDEENLGVTTFPQRVTFPANFDGSPLTPIALPTATTETAIMRWFAGTPFEDAEQVGTLTYNTDGTFAFTTDGGMPLVVEIGDALFPLAQASADATAAYAFTLIGAR